jgi:hypothetical protein
MHIASNAQFLLMRADRRAVRAEGEKIILESVRCARTREVWEKLERLGITEVDVADALRWARKSQRRGR